MNALHTEVNWRSSQSQIGYRIGDVARSGGLVVVGEDYLLSCEAGGDTTASSYAAPIIRIS